MGILRSILLPSSNRQTEDPPLLSPGHAPSTRRRPDIPWFNNLHLRGGGPGKTRPLADDELVPRRIWFFAGGIGPRPNGKQLRERKRREELARQRHLRAKQARKAAKEAKKNSGGGWFPALRAIWKGSPVEKAPEHHGAESRSKEPTSKSKTSSSRGVAGQDTAEETAGPSEGAGHS